MNSKSVIQILKWFIQSANSDPCLWSHMRMWEKLTHDAWTSYQNMRMFVTCSSRMFFPAICTFVHQHDQSMDIRKEHWIADLQEYWTTEEWYWTDELIWWEKEHWTEFLDGSYLCFVVLDKLTMYIPYTCPSIMFDNTSSFVVACVLTGCMCELV